MTLDENQLAVILQASVERARELLRDEGGFLPFGARAKPSGEIEFVQIAPEDESEPLTDLIGRLGERLAGEARRREIVGSALIANAHLAGEEHRKAVTVLVETEGFCRSIVVPYRFEGDEAELGEMIPEAAQPTVFAGAGSSRISPR